MPSGRSILTLLFILSIILYGVAILLDLTTGARDSQFYLIIVAMIANIVTLVLCRRQTGGRL